MIKEFESEKTYRLRPEGINHINWNGDGQMNFLRDFQPHKCRKGNNCFASFYDSPSSFVMWTFYGALKYFDEVPHKITNWKKVIENA